MAKTLELVFRNQGGKQVTIRLAEPKDELTAAAVQAVMQDMVAKNVFTTSGGDLQDIVESRISTRDSVVLA